MSAPFQVNDVEELLQLMEHWSIGEMHLSVGEASLDLVRAARPLATSAAAAECAAAPVATPAVAVEPVAEPVTIFASVVGVFHLAGRGFPQGRPHPGDAVQAGQLLGAIELLRIPTDLVSPISGTLEAILVDEGAGVEYGQPLLVIRPFDEVSEDEAGMLPPPR